MTTIAHQPSNTTLDDIEAAWDAIARASSRARAHDRLAARAGVRIDRAGAALLRQLGSTTTALRISDLAGRLEIDPPGVTRKAQELERAGLVERTPDAEDRRTVRMGLTPTGRDVLDRWLDARRQDLGAVLEGWSDAERTSFALLLHRFASDIAVLAEARR